MVAFVATWGGYSQAEYRSMEVTVTAYNAVPSQTDGDPWLGACGKRLDKVDHPIAVSRDLFTRGLDCGTRIALEGDHKEYVVMDKTGARHKRHIDLFMGGDVAAAREFGRRRMRIWWHDESE